MTPYREQIMSLSLLTTQPCMQTLFTFFIVDISNIEISSESKLRLSAVATVIPCPGEKGPMAAPKVNDYRRSHAWSWICWRMKGR